ncbi:DUF6896 domain-containing protein [Streptomyces microflavus]|uniref:DUF6896 domain-containing protein n=1 Tax=Streptomyces microflavus TaxID=1919 RepID=UPI00382E2B08
MEGVGAARDLVLGYVHALNAIDDAMRVAIPSLERLADFLGPARSRRISRSGHVGTYSYKVHGAGCLFERDNGTEVDVDFAADGSEVFDLWRLRRYGLSLPTPLDVTDEDIRSAVRSLQPPLTEVRPGWFSVAAQSLRSGPESAGPRRSEAGAG